VAFAHASGEVDARNVGRAYGRVKELYFVDFSNEVGARERVILANEQGLII
jgi:hypothetical protein